MESAHIVPQGQYYVKNIWVSFSYILQTRARKRRAKTIVKKQSNGNISCRNLSYFMRKPEIHNAVMHIALGFYTIEFS